MGTFVIGCFMHSASWRCRMATPFACKVPHKTASNPKAGLEGAFDSAS